jgi:metal-sulfur cluster biosynthetic enzyme
MSVSTDKIYEALKRCFDPEIPFVNIVDLGLIYDVYVDEADSVAITMTLTARGCPMSQHIADDVRSKVMSQVEGVRDVHVEIVWEPQWTKNMISAEGKKLLGLA